MATYQLTSDKGEVYEIDAPDDATEEQVYSVFNSHLSGAQPAAQQEEPGFLDKMVANFQGGVQAAKDLAHGNYQGIGEYRETPKTEALSEKVFPTGQDVSFDTALKNLPNVKMSDVSGALLEKFGESAPGKAVAAIGGVHPLYNAVGTAVTEYANPAIEKATGINPDNLALAEMIAGTAGLKKAGTVKDPLVSLAKAGNKYLGTASGVSTNAALGGLPALGKGIVDTAKQAYEGTKARTPEALDQAYTALEADAGKSFADMRNTGALIKGTKMANIATRVEYALGKTNQKLHGNLLSVIDDMKAAAKNGDVDIEDLHSFRKLLQKAGNADKDAHTAGQAIDVLDSQIANLKPQNLVNGSPAAATAMLEGIGKWHQLKKFDKIAQLVRNADGDPNKLKQQFFNFAKNKKNLKGFTAEEKQAIALAGKSGMSEKLARLAGKFGADIGGNAARGNTVLPIFAGIFGTAAGGPIGGGAAVLAGTLAKTGQRLMGAAKAENALKTIEGTAPPAPVQAQPALVAPQLRLPAPADIGNAATSGVIGGVEAQHPSAPAQAVPVAPVEAPVMAPQSALPQDIRQDEGLRHTSYMDTTGNKTVGYGFNMDSGIARQVWKRAGIEQPFEDVYHGKAALSDAQVEALGAASEQVAIEDVTDLYSNYNNLSPSRREALLNLSYQLGKTKLGEFDSFNAAVRNEKWPEAVRHLLKSEYATQVPGRARKVARKLLRDA